MPDYIFINSFSSNGVGYVVFSWIKEHRNTCIRLYDSLLKTTSLPDSIITFILVMIENIYVSPPWWNNLTESKRDTLIGKFEQGAVTHTVNDALITNEQFGAMVIKSIIKVGYD